MKKNSTTTLKSRVQHFNWKFPSVEVSWSGRAGGTFSFFFPLEAEQLVSNANCTSSPSLYADHPAAVQPAHRSSSHDPGPLVDETGHWRQLPWEKTHSDSSQRGRDLGRRTRAAINGDKLFPGSQHKRHLGCVMSRQEDHHVRKKTSEKKPPQLVVLMRKWFKVEAECSIGLFSTLILVQGGFVLWSGDDKTHTRNRGAALAAAMK